MLIAFGLELSSLVQGCFVELLGAEVVEFSSVEACPEVLILFGKILDLIDQALYGSVLGAAQCLLQAVEFAGQLAICTWLNTHYLTSWCSSWQCLTSPR